MSANHNTFGVFGSRAYRKARCAGLVVPALMLAGCLPGEVTTRDYSTFQTYQFEQTPGLGFCASKDLVFSAEITRAADGTMAFGHSVLVLAGPDPEQCEDGVAAQEGCLRPKPQPSRTLSSQEAEQVSATFADLDYYIGPDPICRQLAIDPCVIERHSWDADELSDYICGADRLGDDQRNDIRQLLSQLRNGI